jgi:hypothetical protein
MSCGFALVNSRHGKRFVFIVPVRSQLTTYLLTCLEVLVVLGEAALMLWLLVFGVNAQRWNERASKAAQGT